ncbi:hypothetical protein [Verminephrobacter eiseniae]|uniref:hypothetical protein n=1 Tax=Verminephrobacter eiseniae TaxID=364317 RepID=UPI0022370337|nr:hypothetical protein [Verminephrobacter eiseniae]
MGSADRIRKLHQNYYLATTTAMTVVLYENDDSTVRETDLASTATNAAAKV